MKFNFTDEQLEFIWLEVINAPVYYNKENKLCLSEDCYIFFKDTLFDEIFEWFDEYYSKGVEYLIKYKRSDDMNKIRRKQLNEAKQFLQKANEIISDVLTEESCAFENLSEGLQCTMRGEQMEENISEMEEAIDKIEEALERLEYVI